MSRSVGASDVCTTHWEERAGWGQASDYRATGRSTSSGRRICNDASALIGSSTSQYITGTDYRATGRGYSNCECTVSAILRTILSDASHRGRSDKEQRTRSRIAARGHSTGTVVCGRGIRVTDRSPAGTWSILNSRLVSRADYRGLLDIENSNTEAAIPAGATCAADTRRSNREKRSRRRTARYRPTGTCRICVRNDCAALIGRIIYCNLTSTSH